MQIENKTTHGIYGVLIAFITVVGGTLYQAKEVEKKAVLDAEEAREIMRTEILMLKNDNLEQEKEELEDKVKMQMRQTSTERLVVQNTNRIEKVEEQYIKQEVLLEEIKAEVSE